MQFFKRININLKFTILHDTSTITFLDVRVFCTSGGKLRSTLFRKEMVGNTVLHADSFHPTPLIPFGQYLRLSRNCPDDNFLKEEAGKLQDILLERGYSQSCLRRAFNKAATKSRNDLLFKSQVKQTLDCNTTWVIMHFSKKQTN